MALADTAELVVKLTMAGNFTRQISGAKREFAGLGKSIDDTQGRAYKAGTQIGTGIKRGAVIAAGGIAFLASQIGFGLKQLGDLEQATAATNAVIASTKGVAGITAEEVRHLAEQYENLNATMDDKVIQSGENVLLTFTNIRKEAFQPAIEAALNLSTAMGQDLQSSVVQIGKALNDPVKGITALTRVGVTFTKKQQDQIKALVKTGDLLGAQKIILGELGTEFGGAFAAQGKTAEGTIAGIGDAVQDLQKSLAVALFPTIQKVLPKIREALTSPEVVAGVTKLGDQIAGLFTDENISAGADILKSTFAVAKEAAPFLVQAAQATAGIVRTAVDVFKSLPPEIQSLAVGAFAINKITGGLVTNVAGAAAGGIAQFLAKQFAGVMKVNAATVIVTGATGVPGAGGAPVPAGGAQGTLGKIANIASKVIIVGMVAEVADLIHTAISPGGGLEGRTETGQTLPTDNLSWPWGPKNTPKLDIGPFKNLLGGDSSFTPVVTAIDTAAQTQAANQVHTNDRLDAIHAAALAQNAKADALNASVSQVTAQDSINSALERAASASAAAVIASAATTSSNSETSAIRSAAAAQTSAVTSRIADGTSETRAVAAAVRAKKLSVTTNVNVQSKVSIANIIKQTTAYKSVHNVES